MQAGVASVVITPTRPILLSGYAAREGPSKGTLHDLYGKALVLQGPTGNHSLLITTDLLAVSRSMTEEICQRISQQTGIPRAAMMVSASHTHYGPVVGDILEKHELMPAGQVTRVRAYTRWLIETLSDAAVKAVNRLQPVHLSYAQGEASFAVNRRQYTLEGIRIGENPIGPVDHTVPVLQVRTDDHRLMAVVFGYACHNTTQPASQYRFNGDWAGFAQHELESLYPGCTALFVTGCGGDANPSPRGHVDLAQKHGMELARAVQDVLLGTMQPVEGIIRTDFREIDLPLSPAPTRETIKARLASINPFEQVRTLRLKQIIESTGEAPQTHPYPVQVWQIGDTLQWIALGGEVVVDYALLLRHSYGQTTWVSGYANDIAAYIPSLRVLREGGYEVDDSMIYYGLHGRWAEPVESTILQAVDEMLSPEKDVQ